MQLISCHDGKLIRTDTSCDLSGRSGFATGLQAIDRLLPAGKFARAAIHEILWSPGHPRPFFFTALLAAAAMGKKEPEEMGRWGDEGMGSEEEDKGTRRQGDKEREGEAPSEPERSEKREARSEKKDTGNWQLTTGNSFPKLSTFNFQLSTDSSGLSTQHSSLATDNWQLATANLPILWCDPAGEIYPPALWATGIPPHQLLLLRPKDAKELTWAVGQCLACRGVAATVAQIPPLSRIEARRMQLLAQRGGGCGLFLRQLGAGATHHAATTRWLVSPAPGERTVQRWKIELIGGHGGLLHCPVYLEYTRDPQANRLRATDRLAPHRHQTPAAKYG